MKSLKALLDTEIDSATIAAISLGIVAVMLWHVLIIEAYTERLVYLVRDMRHAVVSSAASGARESE